MKIEFKSYSQYKPSKYDYIGKLPEHWTEKRVKFLTPKVRTGTTPSSIGADYFTGGDVYWYNPGDFSYENIKLKESKKKIHDAFFEDNSIKRYPKGSVLIVGIGATLGKVGLAERESYSNQQINAILPSEKYYSPYLAYALFCYTETLKVYSNATTLGIMNQEKTKNFNIPYPDFSEQTLIAQFLDQKTDQIDKLIEQKEKLLKLLAEKRTTIITQAVTKGLAPDVEMKDSGIDWLGDVPKYWTVCYLKHKAQITYGLGGEIDKTLTDGIKLLSLPNVNKEGTLILDHIPFADITKEEAEELLLQKGDLLFNWRNGSSDHLGKTAYFDLEGEYLHVSFLLRIRVDKKLNNPRYFQFLLHSLRLTGFFTSSKAGVNNTFNQNELRNLWVMIPPLKEQNSIADFISSKISKIDQVRIKIETGINKLKEYREALITSAVTGQIDVRKEANHE